MQWKLHASHVLNMAQLPSHSGASTGSIMVRIQDIPEQWLDWLEINPRAPMRKGVYTQILDTVTNRPQQMLEMNQGIVLIAKTAKPETTGSQETVIEFGDKKLHGVVNGGHTTLACVDGTAFAKDKKLDISKGWVKIHIYTGVSPEAALNMAKGFNTQKQVKDTSLFDQAGFFDEIHTVMDGVQGAESIVYYEGCLGFVDISEVVQVVNMFNCERYRSAAAYSESHPKEYARNKTALFNYRADYLARPSPVKLAVTMLPEFLKLRDRIIQITPTLWNQDGRRKYGSINIGHTEAINGRTVLPFIGAKVPYQTATGLWYPMLAAFRANITWNLKAGKIGWTHPIDSIFHAVMPRMVERYKVAYYEAIDAKITRPFEKIVRDSSQLQIGLYEMAERVVESPPKKVAILIPKTFAKAEARKRKPKRKLVAV